MDSHVEPDERQRVEDLPDAESKVRVARTHDREDSVTMTTRKTNLL
jgi:hypothetical protein